MKCESKGLPYVSHFLGSILSSSVHNFILLTAMSRNPCLCIVAVLIGTGYWLSSSAADPRGTPRERDLQTEVDQLRLELNELRSRLDALDGDSVRTAAAPHVEPAAPRAPLRLPELQATPVPVPLPPDRPTWAPEGSQRGEINGHTYYIIPLHGDSSTTIRAQ